MCLFYLTCSLSNSVSIFCHLRCNGDNCCNMNVTAVDKNQISESSSTKTLLQPTSIANGFLMSFDLLISSILSISWFTKMCVNLILHRICLALYMLLKTILWMYNTLAYLKFYLLLEIESAVLCHALNQAYCCHADWMLLFLI